jgi:hypothetical protein
MTKETTQSWSLNILHFILGALAVGLLHHYVTSRFADASWVSAILAIAMVLAIGVVILVHIFNAIGQIERSLAIETSLMNASEAYDEARKAVMGAKREVLAVTNWAIPHGLNPDALEDMKKYYPALLQRAKDGEIKYERVIQLRPENQEPIKTPLVAHVRECILARDRDSDAAKNIAVFVSHPSMTADFLLVDGTDVFFQFDKFKEKALQFHKCLRIRDDSEEVSQVFKEMFYELRNLSIRSMTLDELDKLEGGEPVPLGEAPMQPGPPPPEPRKPSWGTAFGRSWRLLTAGMVGAVLALVFTLALLLRPSTPKLAGPSTEPVSAFWRSVLTSNGDPEIIFANADFRGDPSHGMILADHDEYGQVKYGSERVITIPQTHQTFNEYTGIGEAYVTASLEPIFSSLKPKFVLTTANPNPRDALRNLRDKDVIFIGGPAADDVLDTITWHQNLHFVKHPSGVLGKTCIQSSRRQDPYCYENSHGHMVDYAMVTFTKGDKLGTLGLHSVLLLAGNTTFGTWAAGEMVSHEDRMAELKAKLNNFDGFPRDFSVLLQVEVTGNRIGHISIIDSFIY